MRDENGDAVAFGELFPRDLRRLTRRGPTPKTVVFFIRTFWCGQCQDYMFASISQLDPEELKKNNVNVVIISNGSWKIIKAYASCSSARSRSTSTRPESCTTCWGRFSKANSGRMVLMPVSQHDQKFSTFGPMKNRAAYNQDASPSKSPGVSA